MKYLKENAYKFNDVVKYYVGTVDDKKNFDSVEECDDYSSANLAVQNLSKTKNGRYTIIKSTTKFEEVY